MELIGADNQHTAGDTQATTDNGGHIMSCSKNETLVDSIAEALRRLKAVSMLLADADLPSEDHLMEECDTLESALLKLGAVDPEQFLLRIPETVEEVTGKRIATMLSALEFKSDYQAWAALRQINELIPPLKRVVRAGRINRAVVLASNHSIECRDSIAGAMLDWSTRD